MIKQIIRLSLLFVFFFISCNNHVQKKGKNSKKDKTELAAKREKMDFRTHEDSIPQREAGKDSVLFPSVADTGNYGFMLGHNMEPPAFSPDMDLSKLTLAQLRFIKNEYLARNHYLFREPEIRDYFFLKGWYQPYFTYDMNKMVKLSPTQQKFTEKAEAREKELLAQNYSTRNGKPFANVKNIINLSEFRTYDKWDAGITSSFLRKINENGFVITPDNYDQLYNVYEQGLYYNVPNFITTDVYLQLLHFHFDHLLKRIEDEKFRFILADMLNGVSKETIKWKAYNGNNTLLKSAANFDNTYTEIATYELTGKKPAIANKDFDNETNSIETLTGYVGNNRGSFFLNDSLFDYSMFKPRGHYISDSMKMYFKAMMWLQQAPINIDNDKDLAKATLLADMLINAKTTDKKTALDDYMAIYEPTEFIVGEADNISIMDIVKYIKDDRAVNDPEKLLVPEKLKKIRKALLAHTHRKILPAGGTKNGEGFLRRATVNFMPGRYTPDAEILQRLVHTLNPRPLRPFPKAMDVYAVLGNKEAENILLKEYHEAQNWPAYPDTLKKLQKKFSGFKDWDKTAYNKILRGTTLIADIPNKAPYYMYTEAWQRKSLNTALAGYTGLKHDLILYAQQANAAESGDGEDYDPVIPAGYVDPNISFWKNSVELIRLLQEKLQKYGLETDTIAKNDKGVLKLGEFLLNVSKKEIANEKISDSIFNRLQGIGGWFESLTLDIKGDRNIGMEEVKGPDKSIALAADVYTYYDKVLEEGVGKGDAIYVMVEINGLLYIAKGAVFSYYEFPYNAQERLNDTEWQEMLDKGQHPPRPDWMKGLYLNN